MPKILMTTDLHLNLRPDDTYRWKFLADHLVDIIEEEQPDELYILGDITHNKDRHPAELVNGTVEMLGLLSQLQPITILMGNHDYVDPDTPFMQFLQHVQIGNRISFISSPTVRDYVGDIKNKTSPMILLPHARDPTRYWAECDVFPFKKGSIVFMHQSVFGAVASNGMPMEGMSKSEFNVCRRVFSGDIHVPQRLGKVIYVGTPYPVYFGDYFEPRLILYDTETNRIKSIVSDRSPRKISYTITDPDQCAEFDIRKNDFVKVTVQLKRSDFPLWKGIRETVKAKLDAMGAIDRGIEIKEIKRVKLIRKQEQTKQPLKAMNDAEAVDAFSSREKLGSDLKDFGKDLL